MDWEKRSYRSDNKLTGPAERDSIWRSIQIQLKEIQNDTIQNHQNSHEIDSWNRYPKTRLRETERTKPAKGGKTTGPEKTPKEKDTQNLRKGRQKGQLLVEVGKIRPPRKSSSRNRQEKKPRPKLRSNRLVASGKRTWEVGLLPEGALPGYCAISLPGFSCG
ncbi:hypothetical protein HOLleu_26492 [Holothuria leucospilota]|uniref:Uncharacterized protein n=1 Tax=Holothuria leucospilota TaxID=206669 RepID=A0A9Q1H007_HOLLE|nr:hypothetical protein HOLleu_26492 [Holothuria leucospilota]